MIKGRALSIDQLQSLGESHNCEILEFVKWILHVTVI
jgi:hypothetical protein